MKLCLHAAYVYLWDSIEILISKNANFCFCLSFHKGVAHYSYGNPIISCMYNACCRNIELQKLFGSVTTEFDGVSNTTNTMTSDEDSFTFDLFYFVFLIYKYVRTNQLTRVFYNFLYITLFTYCWHYYVCLVLVQFMVSVLSKVFRECQAKHKHVNDNGYRLPNRISSHLCLNKDSCFLSLSSFLTNCSYSGDGKEFYQRVCVLNSKRVVFRVLTVCSWFVFFFR